MDHPSAGFEGPIGPTLERELHLLELLLDDTGLNKLRKRSATHPAVKRYDTIRTVIDTNARLNYPDEMGPVLQAGSTLLDSLRPGTLPEETLALIDDHEVLRQLRFRVLDPEQFDDQMTALSCWGLLLSNGVGAKLVEKHGMPDICITLADNAEEWVEVKRIHTSSQPGRARKVIEKANRQIKQVDEKDAGSLYLSIERQQKTLAFDDSIPSEIQSFIGEVERELGSGNSKSIHSVIVAWDDYQLFADSPDRTCYLMRRRSLVLNHQGPRRTSRLEASAFKLNRFVALPLKSIWSGAIEDKQRLSAIKAENITVTEAFRTECEKPGFVRSVHALAAVQNPDSAARYEFLDIPVVLVTKRVTTAHQPYTLLLIVSTPDTDRLNIMLGFRVYTDDLDTSSSHPFDLFMAFLKRYGCPIRVESYHGLFIPNVVVNGTEGKDTDIVIAEPPPGEVAGSAFALFKILSKNPLRVHVNWAFAILIQRYAKDLKRHLK